MKLFIASDIHGSAFFCEQMLKAFDREKADRLVLLGDLLYHGPRNDLPKGYDPKKVCQMLNSYADAIFAIRGNCDSEVDAMVLNFPIMADYTLAFDGDKTLFFTHGHIYSPEKLPPLKENTFFLSGHTHVPICKAVNGVTCLNPGSVSIPKENSSCGYIIYENGVFVHKDLHMNIIKI